MEIGLSPLSVVFIWHPDDENTIKPLVDNCFSLLSSDINNPFSRSMNLPVFFRTTNGEGVPSKIAIESEKIMIFAFLSKEIAYDKQWIVYIKEFLNQRNCIVIPIAIDEIALNFGRELNDKNYIRAYEFKKSLMKDLMFISIAHEIYRYALNESFKEKALGKENAITIFLSHAKDGKNGIKLAKALKKFIDYSQMQNFFDATDIGSGYKFDDEIEEYIKKSTVIAIHSDVYSSRYWCQRELLSAKKHDRPIVSVDILEESEDRIFPFASNIPAVHVHINKKTEKKDLVRILKSALLETIHLFYSKMLLNKYRSIGIIEDDTEICIRPPEVSDVQKIFSMSDDNGIKYKCKSIIYPEPPLYNEELSFLSDLGIKIGTPLTINSVLLKDKKIGISISELFKEELIYIGQSEKHLTKVSQDLARHFLARDATLIYGGDLRVNGFTKFLFDEAKALQTRTKSKNLYIKNYIAWPIYNDNNIDIKTWIGKYMYVAEMVKSVFPKDTADLVTSEMKNIYLEPDNVINKFIWSSSLTEMRKEMISECDFRICAGGRNKDYKGRMPGTLEEIKISIELNKPIFLLGGFGGITASVCKFIESGKLPDDLTIKWQMENNIGYKELVDFASKRNKNYDDDYNTVVKSLNIGNLNNGLNEEDNIKLFNTPFIDQVLILIFKGLENKMKK